jgi:hypothetical protein
VCYYHGSERRDHTCTGGHIQTTNHRFTLIDLTSRVSPSHLLQQFPDRLVFACDFRVDGIERGREVPGGYQLGNIVNVDHHAPTPRMMRPVSSTNLATERVRALGPAPEGAAVVINHTDCDSVLSGGIMAGLLEADDRLGEAAIAADHTGASNPIADLLQSLEPVRDLDLASRSLQRLLSGLPLEDDGSRWRVKLRLGRAAPAGLTLHDIAAGGVDPAYDGRWNAGSNKRGGGTELDPETYAARVDRRVRELGGRESLVRR